MLDFKAWLTESQRTGSRVFGYGAAAKASTILNSFEIPSGSILGIADASPEKQSRFLPDTGIQIITPEQLVAGSPTDIVIFPWNIKDEIVKSLNQILPPEIRKWCLIPSLHQVIQ